MTNTRETWIIKFMNVDSRLAGYHRGETGMCYDRRDAKIYPTRKEVDAAVEELRKTSHFTPVQLRRL